GTSTGELKVTMVFLSRSSARDGVAKGSSIVKQVAAIAVVEVIVIPPLDQDFHFGSWIGLSISHPPEETGRTELPWSGCTSPTRASTRRCELVVNIWQLTHYTK